jgi:LPXTG-motif cell wall-anchored protein
LFTRVVPIVVLTSAEFTYRMFPDAADLSVFYDIVHLPTDHLEPGVDAGVDAGAEVDPAAVDPAVEMGVSEHHELATTGDNRLLFGAVLGGAVFLVGGLAVYFRRREAV